MPCRYRARPKIPFNADDVHLQRRIFHRRSIVRAFPCCYFFPGRLWYSALSKLAGVLHCMVAHAIFGLTSAILSRPLQDLPVHPKTKHRTCFDISGEETIPNIDERIQQLHNGGRQCKVEDQITIKDLIAGIDSASQEKKLFVIAGTIANFKFNEGIWYSACHSCYCQYQACLHTKQCNKCKIQNSNMIKRPRLKVEVKDETCQIDITLFGRDAELVMGVPLTKLMPVDGKEIARIELEDILNVRLQRKYIFNISVTPKNVTYAKKKSFTATSVVEA